MRLIVSLLTAALLVVGSAAADEAPARPKPSKVERAADAVLAAAKDPDALKALAEKAKTDPWLVADALCYRGEHDAAEAFSKAAPRVDVEKLPAYVGAWRKREPDKAERALLAAMKAALRSGAAQKVVDGTATAEAALGTVIQIQLAKERGFAYRKLGKFKKSEAVLRKAADAASGLGWLRRAVYLYKHAGMSAYRGSDWANTLADWEKCLALYARRGDKRREAETRGNIGMVHNARGDYEKALATFKLALRQKNELGDEEGAAETLGNIALVQESLGSYAEALAAYKLVLEKMKSLGNKIGEARTLGNLGNVLRSQGDYTQALEKYNLAHESLKALGDERGAATTLSNIGDVHQSRGEFREARKTYGTARKEMERLGDKLGAARTRGKLGLVHEALGEYNKATTSLKRALGEMKKLGDKDGAATTLGNLGNVYRARGDYPKALDALHGALAAKENLGDKAGAAEILGHIGNVHQWLGDYRTALGFLERALDEMRKVGDRAGEARTLGNIGSVHQLREDYDEALETYEQARMKLKGLGNKQGEARTLGNIGVVLDAQGNYQKALETYQLALKMMKELKDAVGEAMTLGNLGEAHQHLKDYEQAESYLKLSAKKARSLKAAHQQVAALGMLARLYLETGDSSEALRAVDKALREVEELQEGLADEQGATAREQYAALFAVGALASMREEDVSEAYTFVEGGRAGALLDMLGKRGAMRWKAEDLPGELGAANERAQAAMRAAQQVYDLAAPKKDRQETRAARKALDHAGDVVRAVGARIERWLKKENDLDPERTKTLEDVQGALREDQALVLYGIYQDDKGLDGALALVLRPDEERIVSLGKATEVTEACEALDASDAGVDSKPELDALRKMLVEPLQLDEEVKQVLVAPEGALCYVPFGALFDQAVSLAPSGTTHVLLREEEHETGQGILALGDPDYAGASKEAQAIYHRGTTLSPLPASRKEVETIGTMKLLGKDASEAGLQEALSSQERFRALHFACHGLVNKKRPMLSSLALSRTGEDDGFLTALEILRMQLPADLVVLSACNSSRGKILKGEGIVGFTRAFMFAGAPRVVCSLWKVDDEATQALMIKFYELWNPQAKPGDPERAQQVEGGLGAAAALQKAQAFVRGHDKWKHPYYWAAWVLWGLPD